MTQWLLENRLVALNTVYKKIPQKQVTYRSPKNVEKQLDYILLDKKHQSWSRDAESTDILHMGSDHRCVMARFEIPKRRQKAEVKMYQHSQTLVQNEFPNSITSMLTDDNFPKFDHEHADGSEVWNWTPRYHVAVLTQELMHTWSLHMYGHSWVNRNSTKPR